MEKKQTIIDGTGREVSISEKDFTLVQKDTKIHDVKFNTKATTFFKDAMKRFVQSKSAIIGGAIVGVLCILAFAVPMFTKDVGVFNVKFDGGGTPNESSLSPKLFNSGTGFWDGCVKRTHVVYDKNLKKPAGETYPDGTFFNLETYEEFTNGVASEYGEGGYVNVFASNVGVDGNYYSNLINFKKGTVYTINYKLFNDEYMNFVTEGYKLSIYNGTTHTYLVGSENSYSKDLSGTVIYNPSSNVAGKIYFTVKCSDNGKSGNIFIESCNISSNNAAEADTLKAMSFNSGNEVLLRLPNDVNSWKTDFGYSAYKVKFVYCDFKYDKYEYIYGRQQLTLSSREVLQYELDGILEVNLDKAVKNEATKDPEVLAKRFKLLTDESAIFEIVEQVGDATYNKTTKKFGGYTLIVGIHKYKLLGYNSMPRFIFGTSTDSKDYCKLMFTGMRLSFIIAITVSLVNIIIGLCWGSISGYFGGWVDICMERFCDIISGLPSTVIITLCILYGRELNWGQNADLIALMVALFMTGWMGVSHSTRTQFYRFKGREYVLASRTLGAKDGRLIFKHILPNAAGTIITGSILMIPSVIYTEASIAYLGLGLKNQVLFGVILANANSNYKGEAAFQLYIPTVVMTFLLVSFNLFGNGLRDAFNPTLKGGK